MLPKKGRFILLLMITSLLSAALIFSANALQRGDVDADGQITPADARTALRLSVGLIDPIPLATKTDADAEKASETDAEEASPTDAGKATGTDAEKATATDADEAAKTVMPDEKQVSKMMDVADMDLDGSLTAGDARLILRTSVKLEPPYPYYASTVIKAPTCTEPGLCERISTDATVTDAEFRFTKEIPALGHDTRLGVCSRCGAYQGELLDYYKTNIAAPLNQGVSSLRKANTSLRKLHAADAMTGTLTIGNAKNSFIEAYNHYYAAYLACEKYEEFEEAQKVLYSICFQLLEVVYTREITEANCEIVYEKWSADADAILNPETGLIYSLKELTDAFRNPAGTDATETDAHTGTDAATASSTDADTANGD